MRLSAKTEEEGGVNEHPIESIQGGDTFDVSGSANLLLGMVSCGSCAAVSV